MIKSKDSEVQMLAHGAIENNSVASPHAGTKGFNFGKFRINKLAENFYRLPCPAPAMRVPINSFIYLNKGETYIGVNNDSVLLTEGEMLLIPAGVPISIKYYSNTVGYMGAFSSDFITDLSQNIIERFSYLRGFTTTKFRFLSDEQSKRVEGLFTNLNTLYSLDSNEKHNPHIHLHCDCNKQGEQQNDKLLQLYLLCILQELAAAESSEVAVVQYCQLTGKFLEMLFEPSTLELKPADFAAKLCVSPNHLNKVVKKSTHKSLSEWIEERLMLRAKVLIRNSELSITQIAEQLKISDSSYFARRFKQSQGISPTEYRRG